MSQGLTEQDYALARESLERDVPLGKLIGKRGDAVECVDPETCAAMREDAVAGVSSYELRSEYEFSRSTIRKHLRGDCSHAGGLTHIQGTGGNNQGRWVWDDE